MGRPQEIDLKDALHPSDTEGVEEIKHPIEPPEFELFAQRIIANVGQVKGYILQSYKEAGLDPLVHAMFKEWEDVPAIVKGRVKYLQHQTASNTVATRREVEEFLTQVIRGDERYLQRKDFKRIGPIDAVKELCKMKGFYTAIEIKNTHEIVVPDSIRRMSDDELMKLAHQAEGEVIDVAEEIKELPN